MQTTIPILQFWVRRLHTPTISCSDRNSVHTSAATLRTAEQRLKEIQHRLQSEGRL